MANKVALTALLFGAWILLGSANMAAFRYDLVPFWAQPLIAYVGLFAILWAAIGVWVPADGILRTKLVRSFVVLGALGAVNLAAFYFAANEAVPFGLPFVVALGAYVYALTVLWRVWFVPQ